MKRIFKLIIFLLILALLIIKLKKANIDSSLNSDKEITPHSESEAPPPSSPSSNKPEQRSLPTSNLDHTEEPTSEPATPITEADLDKFKANAEQSAEIALKKLQLEEIESLRLSIKSDEEMLKTIEASGSGVETYKFVENNLEIRKRRLKELLEKNR